MHQKDLTLIIMVVIVAGTFSLIFSSLVLKPRIVRDKAEIVQAISPNMPDTTNDVAYKSFFNPNALNPTQQIKIGDQQNQDPFSGGQ